MAHCYRLGGAVQSHRFPTGEDLHAGERGVFLGGVDNELLPVLNKPAYIVGQAAPGIGDILVPGNQGDLDAAVHPLEFGRRFGAGGYAANDKNLHVLPPSFH